MASYALSNQAIPPALSSGSRRLAIPHGLRWLTEIFLLREKRISVTRFVRLPLSLSWCGKTNPAERTFLPVRPVHGKWHTGLLYAVRPSFGPSKNAGLLAAGDTRKPAVCPCRNVCRPYFSNRLCCPPYLLVQLRPTPSAERHKACPQETFTRPMAAELL